MAEVTVELLFVDFQPVPARVLPGIQGPGNEAGLEDGRIERAPDKSLVLTERGRQDASRVVARHRVVERFLTDSLGYTAGEAHALALGIRGSFPDDAVTRLRELALPATTCPHGWPLDPGSRR